MRLVYKATQIEVKVGDTVLVRGAPHQVTFFRKPHKPASEGHVTLDKDIEYYVSVIGAEWIEREDRTTFMTEEQVIEYYKLHHFPDKASHALDIIWLLTCPQTSRNSIMANIVRIDTVKMKWEEDRPSQEQLTQLLNRAYNMFIQVGNPVSWSTTNKASNAIEALTTEAYDETNM